MKPKSEVYNHFTERMAKKKTSYKCNYCNTVYNFKNATKFVWHLLKCKATPKDVQDSFQQYKKNSQAVTTAFMNRDDQASGVTVSDACKTTYEEIKKDKKHRYVVFYIRDEEQIDVETVGERNAEYKQFLDHLQQLGTMECRYGLFDFEYTHQCQGTSEASKKQTLFLMSWCPDTARVRRKRLYSSSFDALKKSLVGVQKYIEATDLSEASQEAVEEKLRVTDRQ